MDEAVEVARAVLDGCARELLAMEPSPALAKG